VSNSTPKSTGLLAIPRQVRLSDRVAAGILETILSERLRPGEPLPAERELGEQFGVSRTVIREAVRDLRARGLLEVRAGSRIRVATVDPSIVREAIRHFVRSRPVNSVSVTELRAELLVAAAGLAAARTGAGPDLLAAAVAGLHQARGDAHALADAELGFERAVITAADNELLGVVYDSLADALSDARPAILAGEASADRGPADAAREAILDAIGNHDRAGARHAMRAHLGQGLGSGSGNV
jgi:GntR family transcriptional regulator, transcriptional repressor for pyruvate dehydrogenase complex